MTKKSPLIHYGASLGPQIASVLQLEQGSMITRMRRAVFGFGRARSAHETENISDE